MKIYIAYKFECTRPEMEEEGTVYVGTNLDTAVSRLNTTCVIDTRFLDPEEKKMALEFGWDDYRGKCHCGEANLQATINEWEHGYYVGTILLSSDEKGEFKLE